MYSNRSAVIGRFVDSMQKKYFLQSFSSMQQPSLDNENGSVGEICSFA